MIPTFRCAQAADIHDAGALLEQSGLPDGGVQDQFGDALVVAEPFRGKSIGRRLVKECLDKAQRREISEVYLLTTDAQRYFEALGFKAVTREKVPHDITRSPEFASLCPETATVMMLVTPDFAPSPK